MLKQLQERMKALWTQAEYHDEFRNYPAQHKDFAHALLHVVKAAGKLSAVTEDQDHLGRIPFDRMGARRYVADLIICALRMGNTMPGGEIDVEEAVLERIKTKMGPTVG